MESYELLVLTKFLWYENFRNPVHFSNIMSADTRFEDIDD
jgi:hypothetical protein